MYRRFIPVVAVALLLSASVAFAQCGCSVPPVYAPAAPSYTSDYAPQVTYAAPVAYSASYTAPVAYAAPAPQVSYYAPPVAYAAYYAPPVAYSAYYAAPVPYAAYYAPAVAYGPVAVPYRVGYPGRSMYGAPRIYVPGEPVRNTLKAITP